MTVINTNSAATITANALTRNERAMGQTMERLSTGMRINSAADDAAGLAISSKMTSQITGLNQAVRNANDAISMVQTAEGGLIEVGNMLQRMRELSVQAASGTNTTSDIAAMDQEFDALVLEIDRVATQTQWNGTEILDGHGSVAFQVGANASQTISITFADFNKAAGVFSALDIDGGSNTATLAALDITASGGAAKAIYAMDDAIKNVNSERATMGATINRLEYAVDNLSNVSQNASASRSRVMDADYASETTELARTQIIQQAATAMLSQANQSSQSVLALLK